MGKFKTKKLLLVLLLVLGAASLFVLARFAYVYANVPNEINFQGKLTDINGVNVADGTYDFQVRIYNDATADTAGALIYTQSLSGVQVTNGIFNLKFSPSADNLSGGNRYLQVCFDSNATGSDAVTGCGTTATSTGDTAFDKRFLPRKLITSNPYSLISKFLGSNYIYGGDGTESGVLTFLGNTGTAVSPSGAGTIYFDSVSNTFKCSENGGAYVDCINTAAGGVTTIGTIDSQTKSSDGGVISGTTLYYQTADATNPGLVSTGTQTFAGAKTFSSAPTVSAFTQGSVIFAGTGGLLSQNNANLFWDNSSGNLGVGTNTPTSFKIESGGNVGPNVAPTFSYSSTGTSTSISSGLHSSIAIKPNGYPIITFLNSFDKNLYAYNCSNATCTAGSATILTNLGSSIGPKTAVAIRNDGTPIVAYQHGTNRDLMVYDCTSSDCTTGTTHTLDSTGNVGSYAAIAIRSSGLPIISYIDTTNSTVKVYDCSDTSCSSGTARTIDSISGVGNGTSIAIRSGDLPIISYYDDTTNDLNVYDCANSDCSSGTVRTLDSTNDVGIGSVIKIRQDGTPFIAYYALTGNDVKGYSCTNSACSSGTAVTIDSGTNGGYVSMVIGNNGYPIIGYETITPVLKIYYCSNAACSSGTSLTLDSTSGPGVYQSMALGNDGNPLISHTTNTGSTLKVFATTSPSFTGGYNLGSSTKYWNNIYTGTLQLSAAGSTLVGLQASSSSSAWTLTLPSTPGTSGQVLTTNGSGITSWSSLPTAGVTTIGTIDSQTKSADGAVISGSSLYLQTADATNPGLVSTGTQTFAGAKTFSGALTASSTLGVSGLASLNAGSTITGGSINFTGSVSNALNLKPYGASAGNTTEQRFLELAANGPEYVGFKAPDSIGTSQIYTLPSSSSNGVLRNSSGVLSWDTAGYLTSAITSINGETGPAVTFATGTTGTDFNLAVTTNTLTFNLPDASASNRGVVTTGTQSFAGAKTFTSAPTISTFTEGSVIFAGTGGLLSQNNSNFFWDNTNSRLGIGTNLPATALHINGSLTLEEPTYGATSSIKTESFGVGSGYLRFQAGGTNNIIAQFRDDFNQIFTVSNTNNQSYFYYDLGVGGQLSTDGTLAILEGGTSPVYYTTFQGGNQSADISYTLPTTSSNGVLTNTGGILSWQAASSGTVIGTGVSAQVAYWNGASSITGDNNYTWNGNYLLVNSTGVSSGIGISSSANSAYYIGGARVLSNFGDIYNLFVGINSGSTNAGSQNVAVGPIAGLNLGASATANTLVGYNSGNQISSGSNNVLIGAGNGSLTTGSGNVVIGANVGGPTIGTGNVLIGSNSALSSGSLVGTIVLGGAATGTANNQLVVGGGGVQGVNNGYFGNGVTDSSPMSFVLNSTGGSGTNVAGANLTLAGGRSTGTANGGALIFSTSAPGSTGTSANSLASRLTIDSLGSFLFNAASSTPGVSPAGAGKIYFDSSANKFKCSENASAYFDCFSGSAPISGSGTATQVAFWNGVNSLTSSSNLYWDNTNTRLGIGTASPLSSLSLYSSGINNIRIQNSTTGTTASAGFLLGLDTNNNPQLWSFDANNMVFGTGNIERMRITSAGNVGIGTVSPKGLLEVAGSSPSASNYAYFSNNVGGSNPTTANGLKIGWNQSNAQGETNLIYSTDAGSLPRLAIQSYDGTSLVERVSISSNGNLGIGNTNPQTRLTVSVGTDHRLITYQSGDSIAIAGINDTWTGWKNIVFDGAVNVGIGASDPTYKLQVNGQPAANGYTAFTNYSDQRLKTNIQSVPDGSLAKIMQLRPVTFNYNSLTGYDQATLDRTVTGFIAQELQPIFPDMVGTTTINGTQYYDTNLSSLNIYLVKAVQEQQVEIDNLKASIVTNPSNYFTLDSSNNLTTNNSVVINGKLQANSLTIGANKLSIDTNGNLITVGNIQSANLTVTAQLNATNAVIQNLRIDKLAINQTPSTGDATIGSGKIIAGQSTITINNSNITANSKVFLTSKTTSSQPLAVRNINPGVSFDVVVAANATNDIDFDYWIILE